MKNNGIIVAIIIFVLIIVGMFIFAFLKKSEIDKAPLSENVPEVEVAGAYDYIERIDAKHFFIDGVHTLAGEIVMPTTCDLLNWDSVVAESMPEQVTVNFDVINNSESCAQAMTAQRFKVTFTASENAVIRATLEGRAVELNLIPAGPNENPDEFELFIKG